MAPDDRRFPPGLTAEQEQALDWKIEKDYALSHFGAVDFKTEYVAFAINFYTRNRYSLEDVVTQYRAHRGAEKRQQLAHAFMADMKLRIGEAEAAL